MLKLDLIVKHINGKFELWDQLSNQQVELRKPVSGHAFHDPKTGSTFVLSSFKLPMLCDEESPFTHENARLT